MEKRKQNLLIGLITFAILAVLGSIVLNDVQKKQEDEKRRFTVLVECHLLNLGDYAEQALNIVKQENDRREREVLWDMTHTSIYRGGYNADKAYHELLFMREYADFSSSWKEEIDKAKSDFEIYSSRPCKLRSKDLNGFSPEEYSNLLDTHYVQWYNFEKLRLGDI